MKFIPCVTWIERGVAKETPDKISLTKDEIKNLLQGTSSTDAGAAESENEDFINDDDEEVPTTSGQIRSSEDNKLAEYDLDNYDEPDELAETGLTGLTCFATNDEDPYLTLKDEDDESDEEHYNIKPSDNLLVVGLVEDGDGILEVHVYNEEEESFFVHHDILLPTMPLCLEWLNYDPTSSESVNYIAVGGYSSAIEVWDIDLVDSLEPVFVLGSKKKKKEGKASSKQGHTDAVLDLSWNFHIKHGLASSSADCTVALWDMSKGKVVTSLTHYSEKVQTLSFHPFEPYYLLTGTCDNLVKLIDCRDPKNVAKTWNCSGEVEKVTWNHFDPFCCVASTDTGFVHCFDARTDAAVWNLSAHSSACTGLSLSSQCPGFMTTASMDESVKVWDILNNNPTYVHELKLVLGKLYCLAPCPDAAFVMCTGGDHPNHNLKVINFMQYAAVNTRFGDRQLLKPSLGKPSEELPDQSAAVMETDNHDNSNTTNLSESYPRSSKSRKRK